MTIFDIGLFIGVTIALTVFQLALSRLPLWLLKRATISRPTGILVSHLAVIALLFVVMLPAAVTEAVRWLALSLALIAGLAYDLARWRLRRRRSLAGRARNPQAALSR